MKTLKLIVALALVGGVAFVVLEWMAANRSAAALKQTIEAQNKIVDSADEDKRNRDDDLQKALAQINALKRQVKTSEGAVRGLNQVLTLPQPITFEPGGGQASSNLQAHDTNADRGKIHDGSRAAASAAPAAALAWLGASSERPGNVATIPTADLIPLYDYAQNCRACALRLESARHDALDDANKIRALEAERDAAVNTSRGGNFKHRLKNAVGWFALGAGSALVVSAEAPKHRRIK
jgi:hypothetical protein